jgi:hypothetical protein
MLFVTRMLALSEQKRAGVGTTSILESEFLSENAHRTVVAGFCNLRCDFIHYLYLRGDGLSFIQRRVTEFMLSRCICEETDFLYSLCSEAIISHSNITTAT